MSNSPKLQGGDRKARAQAARQAARAKERRRRTIGITVGAALIVAVIGVLVIVTVNSGGGGSSATGKPGSSGSAPSWPAPTGDAATKAVAAAGLQAYGQEMLAYHIHAHLDVIDQGTPVTVPPQIGFVYNSAGQPKGLTSLHTHQPDGIIHIEAPKKADHTLGQFFAEWQVPLTSTCVGTLCADATHTFDVYVNGKAVVGDPKQIVLHPHDEIAVIYAKKGQPIEPPKSYNFPNGM